MAKRGSFGELADFLTHGYWQSTGRSWRKFDDSDITVNITGLQGADRDLAKKALQLWDDVSGLTFSYVSGIADITFDDESGGAYSSSSTSGHSINRSEINISKSFGGGVGSDIDSYRFQTFIHEIGHAIGLGHQGPYNGSASYPADAAFLNDSWQLSVMSYFSQTENTNVNASHALVKTPQLADILAIQSLYGEGVVRKGDTVYGDGNTSGRPSYGTDFANMPTATIHDSGGVDTLNYSGSNADQMIDLAEGGLSSTYGEVNNIIIALGTVIEKAVTGAGDDTLVGNSSDNGLSGKGGDDLLRGLAGGDTLNGGGGGDRLVGGGGGDKLTGGKGLDLLFGGNGNDLLIGGADRDRIEGGSGRDTLKGDAGADRFEGGAGNDRIVGGGGTDMAVYAGGIDRYNIVKAGNKITVIDTSGKLGKDTLVSVEKLSFGGEVVSARKALALGARGDDEGVVPGDVPDRSGGAVDYAEAGIESFRFDGITFGGDDLLA